MSLENLDISQLVDSTINENFEQSELPNSNDQTLQNLIQILRVQLISVDFLENFQLTPQNVTDKYNPEITESLLKLKEFQTLLRSRITGESVQNIDLKQKEFEKLTQNKLS